MAITSLFPIPKLRDEEDVFSGLWRGGISEFFATMIFIFIGCGSVISTQEALGESNISVPSITVISLAHGFAIMVLVYAVGEVSGGHINPAVTWATFITSKISLMRAIVYWISQLVGGIVGAGLLYSILPLHVSRSIGCHSVNHNLTAGQGFWAETIFTFIFIFVVFATAISPFAGKMAPLQNANDYGPGKLTPFAVGMTILILHTVGIPLTGASMNPARSFGPAVVAGCWESHWVYWVGPLFGSTISAVVAQLIFLHNPTALYGIFQVQGRAPNGVPAPLATKGVSGNQDYAIMKEEEMEHA